MSANDRLQYPENKPSTNKGQKSGKGRSNK